MGQCGERIRTVLHESVSDRHGGHGGPVVYWSADRSDDKGDHGQRTGAGIYRAEITKKTGCLYQRDMGNPFLIRNLR